VWLLVVFISRPTFVPYQSKQDTEDLAVVLSPTTTKVICSFDQSIFKHVVFHTLCFVKKILYTVAVKSLDTPTHSRVFIYLYYFLHCRII
jgi:hypothetical protein